MSIEGWGGEHPIKGRVRRIEPSGFRKTSALGVEEHRVNVIIDFETPGDGAGLGDGYRVEARIIVWRGGDVLLIPVGSLFREASEWAAFVVEAGRARVRKVDIGGRNNESAEVRAGVSDGERVVLHPPGHAGRRRPGPRPPVTADFPANRPAAAAVRRNWAQDAQWPLAQYVRINSPEREAT